MSGSLPCFSHISASHDVGPLRITLLILLCRSINTLMPSNLMTLGHGTGHAAHVLGLFGISGLPWLAEDPAVNLPGLVRLRGRSADTCHQPSGQEDRRENVGQGVGATYVRDGHVGILYGSAGRDEGT